MALVLGYYDRQNMGDDQYKITISEVLCRSGFLPNEITFSLPHTLQAVPAGTRVIVCGGGDIINDWFNKPILRLLSGCRVPVFALSIGITYQSTITDSYLGHFQQIYLRHLDPPEWTPATLNKWPVSVQRNHIPDLGFLLPRFEIPKSNETKKIGIFLANRRDYDLEPFKRVAARLIQEGHEIEYLCMNYSQQTHESDISFQAPLGQTYWTTDPLEFNRRVAQLDFAVCMRYHAHIFCIVQRVPFVSYAKVPKVRYLMRDHGFSENVALVVEDVESRFDWAWNHKEYLEEKCNQVARRCHLVLDNFKLPLEIPLDRLALIMQNSLRNGQTPDAVARRALLEIVGTSDNKYLWGFVENLKKLNPAENNLTNITDMLKWLFGDSRPPIKKGIRFLQELDVFAGIHRSGWLDVCKTLKEFETKAGVLCDLYMDATFHWKQADLVAKGILPFKESWIGFIHHTPTRAFGPHNLIEMFNSVYLELSLSNCKGLFVLSNYLANWVRNRLVEMGYPLIPVYVLQHPTESCQAKFNIRKWLENPTLTQIGAWLRDPYAIYATKIPWGQKQVLQGPKMEAYLHPENWYLANLERCSSCETTTSPSEDGICRPPNCGNSKTTTMTQFMTTYVRRKFQVPEVEVRVGPPCCAASATWDPAMEAKVSIIGKDLMLNYQSVKPLQKATNEEYDQLLQETVVFLNLVDCSAANTIVECIVRNTPVVVNPLEAVQEYLGPMYPGYYPMGIDSVWKTFNPARVYKIHEYLVKRDKTNLQLDQFAKKMQSILERVL